MTHFKLLPLLLFVQTISYADYTVIYPLTDSSILIKNKIVPSVPTYTEWASVGEPYNCASSNPQEYNVDEGVTYTKTFNDCIQKQERTKTLDKEITTESRTISISQYKVQSIGTKVAIPSYTEWTNSGSAYNCQSVSPMEDTISKGKEYTKNYTNCSINQTRTKTLNNVKNTETRVADGYSYSIQSVGTRNDEECLKFSNSSRWVDYAKTPLTAPNYKYQVVWNGNVYASFSNLPEKTNVDMSFTSGIYVYTRGTYQYSQKVDKDYQYFYYELCRKPI